VLKVSKVILLGKETEMSCTPPSSNSTEVRVLPLIEKLLKQFPEESSRLRLDEIETRAYLGVVLSLTKLFPGASVTGLKIYHSKFFNVIRVNFIVATLSTLKFLVLLVLKRTNK
jgi:hypothetical protein